MKNYHITFAPDAEDDLDQYLAWLDDDDAIASALRDFNEARTRLAKTAGSLTMVYGSEKLRQRGYRRLNFRRHPLYVLYRVEEEEVFVDAIGHERQDMDRLMK